MKTFLNTLQGKIIGGLTIIALVMGIAAEGIVIYTNWEVAKIKTIEAQREELKWHVDSQPIGNPESDRHALCDNPKVRATLTPYQVKRYCEQ